MTATEALLKRYHSEIDGFLAKTASFCVEKGISYAQATTVLAAVRRRGWAQSLGEREPGVASVSAPVRSPSGRVIAAVSISGPIERLTRQPGRVHAETVMRAALNLTDLVRSAETTSS